MALWVRLLQLFKTKNLRHRLRGKVFSGDGTYVILLHLSVMIRLFLLDATSFFSDTGLLSASFHRFLYSWLK